MITYKPIDQLVKEMIMKYSGGISDSPISSNYSDSVLPYTNTKDITGSDITNIVLEIVNNLNKLVKPYIATGLEVTASEPPDGYVYVTSGAGIVNGHYIENTEQLRVQVPLDGQTNLFYLTFDGSQILMSSGRKSDQLAIAKVVVPYPGTTTAIQDDKPYTADGSYNGWIVSGKDVLFDGTWTFDDDSMAMLGNKLGYVLAENVYGTINLNENLKIENAQGTMMADSNSLKFYYPPNLYGDKVVASQLNHHGVRFFDTNGIELAKFTDTEARVGNIVVNTNSLYSGNFVAGALGAGFKIYDTGNAEFNNVYVRGKITSTVFEKQSISTVGGNLLVMDSDILSVAMTASDNSTLKIDGDTTFAVGDTLRIKDGENDEWLEVTDASSAPTYIVTRDKDSTYGVNSKPNWGAGTAVVNYGQDGDGGIYMSSSEDNSPYLSIITHSGSPWLGVTTQLKLGNLNGFLGYTTDKYGIAIGSTDNYLKYDPYGGLVIKGDITITGGNASVTFYQDDEPGAGADTNTPKNGDYWVDTNDSNKLYVYQTSTWVAVSSDAASGGISSFRQSISGVGTPTALAAGDLWLETDSGRLYRATNSGDDEITAGEWEAQQTSVATPPGAGLYLGSDYMGYYGGASWQSFMKNDGTFEFNGDATNKITWNGATLAIRGSLTADDITAGSLSADRVSGGTLTGTTIQGNTIMTSGAGSRIVMDAAAFTAYDDDSNKILELTLTGTDVGDVVVGDYSSGAGLKWDKSAGTFTVRGTLNADDITAGTLSTDRLSVSTLSTLTSDTGNLTVSGYIQSDDYVAGTTGFKLSSTGGLEVNTGTIEGKTVTDQFSTLLTVSSMYGDGGLCKFYGTDGIVNEGSGYHTSNYFYIDIPSYVTAVTLKTYYMEISSSSTSNIRLKIGTDYSNVVAMSATGWQSDCVISSPDTGAATLVEVQLDVGSSGEAQLGALSLLATY